MVVRFTKDEAPCLKALVESGARLRYVNGTEHARTLWHDCRHGPSMLAGRPCAFVVDGQAVAMMDGDEECCTETVSVISDVIDIARAKNGQQPAFRPSW